MGIIANIEAITEKWRSVNLEREAIAIAQNNTDEIADLNRQQLLAGKDSTGQSLPLYTEDTFFKTKEAATRYMNWKRHISPNKDKPADVMDFFISGYTHKGIFATIAGSEITLKNNTLFANSIQNKTKGLAWGLNSESEAKVWSQILRAPLIARIVTITGASINK